LRLLSSSPPLVRHLTGDAEPARSTAQSRVCRRVSRDHPQRLDAALRAREAADPASLCQPERGTAHSDLRSDPLRISGRRHRTPEPDSTDPQHRPETTLRDQAAIEERAWPHSAQRCSGGWKKIATSWTTIFQPGGATGTGLIRFLRVPSPNCPWKLLYPQQ
jgi:hypothetical protein